MSSSKLDSDGEDKPSDIQVLYEASLLEPDKIVVAKRATRSEGLLFKIEYHFYKVLFGLLTGKVIEFGNFSILPFHQAQRLAYVSEIWNHFQAKLFVQTYRIFLFPSNVECVLRVNQK